MGDIGDPMATQQVCSYISSLKLKKVDFRQNYTNLDVSELVTFWMTSMDSSM